MTNITHNSEAYIPPVEEPEEYSPVDLFWEALQTFNWTDEQFAKNFGWEVSTIWKWVYGQKAGRSARIRAATLKREWKL